MEREIFDQGERRALLKSPPSSRIAFHLSDCSTGDRYREAGLLVRFSQLAIKGKHRPSNARRPSRNSPKGNKPPTRNPSAFLPSSFWLKLKSQKDPEVHKSLLKPNKKDRRSLYPSPFSSLDQIFLFLLLLLLLFPHVNLSTSFTQSRRPQLGSIKNHHARPRYHHRISPSRFQPQQSFRSRWSRRRRLGWNLGCWNTFS